MTPPQEKIKFIKDLILSAGNQIIGVVFFKKNGSKRVMAFRYGIYRDHVKDSASDITEKIRATFNERGMLCVGDLKEGSFRTITLDSVVRLKINKKTYTF
jgi:hypothetical protein